MARPSGGGKGGWPPEYIGVRALIEHIPSDGCLLVFNADHANWRVKVADTGVLRCHVAQNFVRQKGKGREKIRDLYITWKSE